MSTIGWGSLVAAVGGPLSCFSAADLRVAGIPLSVWVSAVLVVLGVVSV